MGKKSFRKIPAALEHRLDTWGREFVRVAAAIKLPLEDVLDHYNLQGVGVKRSPEGVEGAYEVLPSHQLGTFADRNVNGWEKKRKDLPKEIRAVSVLTPNFGDPSKGYHLVTRDVEAYPKDIYPPQLYTISISPIDYLGRDGVILRGQIDQLFKPSEREQILFSLSLLQENFGAVDLVEPDISDDEIAKIVSVDWEFLPKGTREENIHRLLERAGGDEAPKDIKDRVEFFANLAPDRLIRGTAGFSSYIGALYEDAVLVLENLQYGNALYIIKKDWENLSKLTRTELLRLPASDVSRIKHEGRWQQWAREEIKAATQKRII